MPVFLNKDSSIVGDFGVVIFVGWIPVLLGGSGMDTVVAELVAAAVEDAWMTGVVGDSFVGDSFVGDSFALVDLGSILAGSEVVPDWPVGR